MKKLLLSLMAFLFCISVNAMHKEEQNLVFMKGGTGFAATNSVLVMQNGNVLTTTFNVNTHATVVVSKATARYRTYSVTSEEVVLTQTVDAKEFDEVITTIENYEIGVKYIIEIITPEGTLVGEFEITE